MHLPFFMNAGAKGRLSQAALGLLALTALWPACRQAAGSREAAPSAAALPVSAPPAAGLPYDLEAPSQTLTLTEEALREVSGLSPTDEPGILLAIADERGELFFLNAGNGMVQKRVLFRDRGDFEGVEQVGDVIYALKSDGKIFEISGWKNAPSTPPQVQEYDTRLKKENDLEGLGYDAQKQTLLLACKEDPEVDGPRDIFAFSLKNKQLSDQPIYTINPQDIDRLVARNEKDKPHFFSPSGVAMHPLTHEVYVLSSSLKRLAVLDATSGAVRTAVRLDKKLLPQPEGISFDPQGNLYLSSEGKDGQGILLKFNIKE